MSTENSAPETRFSQIWNRDSSSNDEVSKIAAKLANNVGDVSTKKDKERQWGFFDWVKNLFIFFILQLAFGAIWLGLADPDVFTNPTLLQETLSSPVFIFLNAILMYITWIGGMLWVTYRKGKRSFKEDFLVKFKKWDVFIGLGIAALLYGIMIGAQFLLSDVFGLNLEGADNGALFLSYSGAWFIIIAVGIASILGPISEELWFRGFLMNSILKTIQNRRDKLEHLNLSEKSAPISWKLVKFFEKIRYPLAVIVSSAIFGMFHFQGSLDGFGYWFIIIATGTLGTVFAIATLVFKRLGPSIFGHVFYNFSTLMIAVIAMQ